MSYEPSKRMCLKNLPPDCTKKELIDFIKKRCNRQPSNVEIGKGPNGEQKQYAHLSVESMKTVLETVNGIPIRGYTVTAEAAKPHYSVAIKEMNQKRQREEDAAAEELERDREALLLRLKEHPNQLTDIPKNKIKTFYYYRQRYGVIASELAAANKGMKGVVSSAIEHPWAAPRKQYSSGRYGVSNNGYSSLPPGEVGWGVDENGEPAVAPKEDTETDKKKDTTAVKTTDGKSNKRGKGNNKVAIRAKAAKKEEEVPPAAAAAPEPSKQERKVAGLKAKLLALQAKMKK